LDAFKFRGKEMKPSSLTAEQFKQWRKSNGMSHGAAAMRLGLSPSSIHSYEQGTRLEGEVKIPLLVALGMAAVNAGLQPYEGEAE
jgi:predicted transcriptional regulator